MSPKALIVGISGPSSSGKTTLARLLQRIFNNAAPTLTTFIIHEDDFYYPDDQCVSSQPTRISPALRLRDPTSPAHS